MNVAKEFRHVIIAKSFEFGYTKKGFQLWCTRHEENVLAILMGQKELRRLGYYRT